MTGVKVAASLLAADPGDLFREAVSVKEAGADLLHLDVMDGHFVPPITFGPEVARRLSAVGLPLDVHLMVDCLDYAVPAFAEWATYVTVHAEATPHLHRVLQEAKKQGCKVGVAVNPASSVSFLPYVIDLVDLVLVMTVNPGWGGQECLPAMARKVAEVKSMAEALRHPVEIEVDGGITGDSASLFVQAGASILVSGSYIFHAQDRRQAIRALAQG